MTTLPRMPASLTNLSQEWSMDLAHQASRLGRRSTAALAPFVLAFGSLTAAGCASSAPAPMPAAPVMPAADPRVGLKEKSQLVGKVEICLVVGRGV